MQLGEAYGRSLRGRLPGEEAQPNDDVYHEIACEDWGTRPGYMMRVYFKDAVFMALRARANKKQTKQTKKQRKEK